MSCVDCILQSPNRDELTKELVQYQEIDTEVHKRTAELYSEQGHTDITEIMIIDETTQCKNCK